MSISLEQAITLVGNLVPVGVSVVNVIIKAVNDIKASSEIDESVKGALIRQLTASLQVENALVQAEPVYDPSARRG